ncbi:unnamed protein product [Ambrosiozyma monospora]|uniref:Unnamed protein product n=1 Tax=Ambrosiozyma monospora TaxID=43982 RepID=A0ACB5U685_AMBMO|nr:unnamed protein product [Ambrosiozyma monospora]
MADSDSVGGRESQHPSTTTTTTSNTTSTTTTTTSNAPLINGNEAIDKEQAIADNNIDTKTSKVKSGQINQAGGVDGSSSVPISDSTSSSNNPSRSGSGQSNDSNLTSTSSTSASGLSKSNSNHDSHKESITSNSSDVGIIDSSVEQRHHAYHSNITEEVIPKSSTVSSRSSSSSSAGSFSSTTVKTKTKITTDHLQQPIIQMASANLARSPGRKHTNHMSQNTREQLISLQAQQQAQQQQQSQMNIQQYKNLRANASKKSIGLQRRTSPLLRATNIESSNINGNMHDGYSNGRNVPTPLSYYQERAGKTRTSPQLTTSDKQNTTTTR